MIKIVLREQSLETFIHLKIATVRDEAKKKFTRGFSLQGQLLSRRSNLEKRSVGSTCKALNSQLKAIQLVLYCNIGIRLR